MTPSLQPQAYFPIVRQIANHLDGTTYYIRAVVRNADGDIIDTVNLDSKGSQRYQSRYRVPADSSGQGAYISIITSVYTDAGYTTKSSNYGDEENTYLVFDRILSSRGGGGGGNLDIGTIRRVVAEELEKAKLEPVEPEDDESENDTLSPKIDAITLTSSNIFSILKNLKEVIDGLPKENVSLESVENGLKTVQEMITSKEVTPPTDIQPVIDTLDQIAVDVIEQVGELREYLAGTEEQLKNTIVATVEENMKSAKFVNEFKIESATAAKPTPQPEQPVYDINKLAS
jgi:uncharacterized protein YoxC